MENKEKISTTHLETSLDEFLKIEKLLVETEALALQRVISFELESAIQETLYLMKVPGLYKDLKEGLETPLEECIPDSDVWTHYE